MDKIDVKFNGLYYVFEYDIDEGYMVEYLSPCDLVKSNGNFIYEDTCVAIPFTSSFLCSYIYLANRFDNTNTQKFDVYLKSCPQLLTMLENSIVEENIKKTQSDFENLKVFLKNSDCHNLSALKYFCGFANKKMPSPIEDIYKSISFSEYKNNDSNSPFNYLMNNIKYQKNDTLIIEAENRFGMQSFQKIYKILSPLDLFLVTLDILYQLKRTIKLCKNCGLPFLVTRKRNISYCSYNGDFCKIEGRKQKEKNRYTNNEKNRLYRNIKGKFEYRNTGLESDKKWIDLKNQFFEIYDNNNKNDNLIPWLRKVDNLFFTHKKEPFELPDINSI